MFIRSILFAARQHLAARSSECLAVGVAEAVSVRVWKCGSVLAVGGGVLSQRPVTACCVDFLFLGALQDILQHLREDRGPNRLSTRVLGAKERVRRVL